MDHRSASGVGRVGSRASQRRDDARALVAVVLRLMTSRGLTATALAARAGLHTQTVHPWLRGERRIGPRASVLGQVLRAVDQTRALSASERAEVLAALGVGMPAERVAGRG